MSIKSSKFASALALALAISTLLAGGAATAAVSTGTLTATATVLASCTIGAATLAFGVYDPASATSNDAQTTVSVFCTTGSNYAIYSTTPFASRVMTTGAGGAGQVLTFGAFGSVANRTASVQLPLTNTTGTIAGTGTGLPQNVDLFGRVVAGQNVVAGAYTNATTPANLTIEY